MNQRGNARLIGQVHPLEGDPVMFRGRQETQRHVNAAEEAEAPDFSGLADRTLGTRKHRSERCVKV